MKLDDCDSLKIFFLPLNAWYNINYKAIKSFTVSQFYPKHPAYIIFFQKKKKNFLLLFPELPEAE